MKTISSPRIASIDIMRGLTIFLMLFVNDLYEPGVPHWLVHAGAEENSIGLADLVFPGFLFMVGLSVPFAIESRRRKGHSNSQILRHILWRTVSLLVIGVLIYNGSERINEALTGIPKLVWLFLLYTAVFLIWNDYTGCQTTLFKKALGTKLRLSVILKATGLLLLIFLVFKFRGGTPERPTWLRHGWWGILGLIGWGYLAAAMAYVFAGRKILSCLLLWVLALILNIGSLSGWQGGLGHGWLRELLEVWLGGNVPAITLAGLSIGMCLQRNRWTANGFAGRLVVFGLLSLAAGFVLRHWFIFSKIIGTPSWALVCNGVSMMVFAALFYIIDIRDKLRWAYMFRLAGRNALTTYLSPDMLYFIIWYFGWPLLMYKQPSIATGWVIGGSVLWAALMIVYAHGLSKIHIRLKL